jgi:hypothetical protein
MTNLFIDKIQTIKAEWDDEGIYVYQAFNDSIADFALEHGFLGGPEFKTTRMTWIKPSFAWMLYRSNYGGLDKQTHSKNQSRILKIKISHSDFAQLLSHCGCGDNGGKKARVQWDPERDLFEAGNDNRPRKMLNKRAIQIGLSHEFSKKYVSSAISIEDVTNLAHSIGQAHRTKPPNKKITKSVAIKQAMNLLDLPEERLYIPHCSNDVLINIAMCPGKQSYNEALKGHGKWRKKM